MARGLDGGQVRLHTPRTELIHNPVTKGLTMQTRNTLQLTTAMLAIAAGTGIGLSEGDGAVVFQGGGTGHSSGETDDIIWGQGNFNRFISDDTIAENQSIYENREAIALLAQFVGPGPTNIQPLIAGDIDGWLEAVACMTSYVGIYDVT